MPRTIPERFGAALALYRQTFTSLLPLVAINIAMGVAQTMFFAEVKRQPAPSATVVIGLLAFFVITVMTSAAVILRLDDGAAGRPPRALVAVLGTGLLKVPALLIGSLLYALAFVLGSLLLLVPGAWLSVSLAFFYFAVLLEAAGPLDGLRRSHQLVSGYWWPVAWTITVLMLAGLVLGVVEVLTGFAVQPSMVPLTPGVAPAAATGLSLAVETLSNAVNAVLAPLFSAVLYVTYRELQQAKAASAGASGA